MAAVAVLALIACAFVAFVPAQSEGATATAVAEEIPSTVGSTAGEYMYFIDSESTTTEISMSATEGVSYTVFIPVGTALTIKSVASGQPITVYTYTGTPALNEETTDVTADYIVTYNTDTELVFNANSTNEIALSATTTGYSTSTTSNILLPADVATFKPADGNTEIYNKTQFSAAFTDGVNLTDGDVFTVPAGFASSITVNGITTDDGTEKTNNTIVIKDDLIAEGRTTAITVTGGADGALVAGIERPKYSAREWVNVMYASSSEACSCTNR